MTARLWRWLLGPVGKVGMSAALILVALVTVLFGAYQCGRRSVKPIVVTETRTVEVVRWKDRTVTQSNAAEQEQTRTREITRWLPGQVVEREVVKWREAASVNTTHAVRDVTGEKELRVTAIERIAAPERNWAVTLQGGMGIDGRKVAAVSVERRLFGGVSVVGTVTSDKACLLGARFAW